MAPAPGRGTIRDSDERRIGLGRGSHAQRDARLWGVVARDRIERKQRTGLKDCSILRWLLDGVFRGALHRIFVGDRRLNRELPCPGGMIR